MQIQPDRRTKTADSKEIFGFPQVYNYPYLGIIIDNTLKFDVESSTRTEICKSLAKLSGKLKHPVLTGSLSYAMTEAFVKSKVWYQLTILSLYSKKIKALKIRFLYRNAINLMQIRGNPSRSKVFDLCYGLNEE